jgi:hypothetical protein
LTDRGWTESPCFRRRGHDWRLADNLTLEAQSCGTTFIARPGDLNSDGQKDGADLVPGGGIDPLDIALFAEDLLQDAPCPPRLKRYSLPTTPGTAPSGSSNAGGSWCLRTDSAKKERTNASES